MNRAVTIEANPGRRNEVMLHPEKAVMLGLEAKKFIAVSFGNVKQHAQIRISSETGRGILGLSPKLIRQLNLPDYPAYELRVIGTELRIGPYIGLLLSSADRKLTVSRLKRLLVYVHDYPGILGAVVLFALDRVDREARRIEGYCFNPVAKSWQRGIFPYPASIYRTIGLGAEWKNHFLSAMGDTLFNSRYFNKWELYRWFSGEPGIGPHLPHTQLYGEPQDVLDMLGRHGKVYLKPLLGLRGRGIVRASSNDQTYTFEYRENKDNRKIEFDDLQKAMNYLGDRFGKGKYLVQQGIDLLEFQGRVIDFRCIVQKNQFNEWVCQAIIGRAGVRDSVVSNISSGGEAFTAKETLRLATSYSNEQIEALTTRMRSFAITVCNRVSGFGVNCGTLGLDIGVDLQGELWLIEVNNRDPDPGIALDVHDTGLYQTLKTGPLLYAKYLAGFSPKEELWP